MNKIMAGLLFTLALLSHTVFYAEEAPEIFTATTTVNLNVSPENLNVILRSMTIEELFVEADAWLALLNEVSEKVDDTELSLQEKNEKIVVLKAMDHNSTVLEEREGIQQQIAMVTEEKSAIFETLTKLRAEKKTMLARLNTVLKNINEQYKVNYADISNGTLDMKNVEDLDEYEEVYACEDQS